MTTGPRFSVVIVNWNVRELLRECLRSVQNETDLHSGEVIVVDNASSDGSVEMIAAEFPWVRLIINPVNQGFAGGNNRAFALCGGRYLILLNADTVVVDRALDRLVDWMERHPRAGVAGCRLQNTDGSLQRWTGGSFPNLLNLATHYFFLDFVLPARLRPKPLYRVHDDGCAQQVDWVCGACLIARREALHGTLFDEAYFMYAEDMELCERVASHGWEVWYTPQVTVVHHHGRSMMQQSTQVALSALRSPRAFFARTRGRGHLFVYDLITSAGFLVRWLAFGIASRMFFGHDYRRRAVTSRQLMIRAVQVMLER